MSPGISLQLPRDPSASSQARDAVRGALRGRVSEATLTDVLIAVSELVTNAVLHGRGEIELRTQLAEGVVTGEVVDQGSGFEHSIREQGLDAIGGRGLLVVSRVAECWGVHEGTTHVWFEIAVRDGVEQSHEPWLGTPGRIDV